MFNLSEKLLLLVNYVHLQIFYLLSDNIYFALEVKSLSSE